MAAGKFLILKKAERPSAFVWIGILALLLLVPGIREGLRRDAFLTWLWLGFAIAGGGVIALNSGNVGTVVRIRDSIVPFVVSLSALGAVSVFRALAARDVARHAPVSAPVAQEGM